MEILRETLKILFHRQNPKGILDLSRERPKEFSDKVIDNSSFQRLLCKSIEGQSTLDNATTITQHLRSVWMNGKPESHLFYAQRETVFNVLLHFSSETLSLKAFEPVCRYEHLLRWHDLSSYVSEDLLTTSFLAASDIYNHRRRYSFCWAPVLGHDNRALNELLKRPMMDLHFHLNGSSFNFEVNWLSLMNKISGRSKTFKKLEEAQQELIQTKDSQSFESFHLCVIKAAALRMLLFEYVINNKSVKSIPHNDYKVGLEILKTENVEEATLFLKNLDEIIQRLRHLSGKKYSCPNGSLRVPDYAILDSFTKEISMNDGKYVLSVLSGERGLMYELFHDIYSHTQIDKQVVSWFYAYILYKSRFRAELVQNNDIQGFKNFSTYEERKSLFLKRGSVYESLLSQLAVISFLNGTADSDSRWLEIRVAPKKSYKALLKHLREIQAYIRDPHFISEQTANSLENNYGIVLHFIKKTDKNFKEKNILLGQCRHYDLRYDIKRQALAIAHLRMSRSKERELVLGIDAANSEILARPEVFAQAFRYLRECSEEIQGLRQIPDLGMTFHIGEDYLDIVDGLRAIDELREYLQFRNGDRLGHAVVLGVDVKGYYSQAHNCVILPAQILLDNVAWLYFKGKDLPEFTPASKELENLFEMYCRKIYGHISLPRPSIRDYYLSWLLRGDNPQYYFAENQDGKHKITSRWSMFNLNDNPAARKAREDSMARSLYEAYHFNPQVRSIGQETVMEHISDKVVDYVYAVQKQMLYEIERQSICVECNPTSNLRIGHFSSYSTHPILRMYNESFETDNDRHSISVSINTDDKGIFATSLEREYSLLALSLEKKYVRGGKCSPRAIYEWLDRIRQMSEEQRF